MPESWGSHVLPFIGIGRVKDCIMLANQMSMDSDEQREQTMDVFRKLLAAASSKLTAGQRTRLQWNEGSVCCLMDATGDYFYCVVSTLLTYPERLAYQLLYDLIEAASQEPGLDDCAENGAAATLGPKLKELVTYYEDPKNHPQYSVIGQSRSSLLIRQPSVVGAGMWQGNARSGRYAAAMCLFILALIGLIWVTSRAEAPGGSAETSEVSAQTNLKAVHGVATRMITIV